jgi:hypothetical protein
MGRGCSGRRRSASPQRNAAAGGAYRDVRPRLASIPTLVLVLAAACGAEAPQPSSSADDATARADDAASRDDAAGLQADDLGPDGGANLPSDAAPTDGAIDAGATDPTPLPTTREALVVFARERSYASWPSEPEAHASAGPHGGRVRTWVNPTLAASLRAGATTHPAGSVAVKELYGSGTTITGWAIDVKRDDGVWVFWEGFLPQLDQFYFVGVNNLCGRCHQGGVDTVLTRADALR